MVSCLTDKFPRTGDLPTLMEQSEAAQPLEEQAYDTWRYAVRAYNASLRKTRLRLSSENVSMIETLTQRFGVRAIECTNRPFHNRGIKIRVFSKRERSLFQAPRLRGKKLMRSGRGGVLSLVLS